MFYLNIKEFLDTVCNEIKYKPANKPISEELECHINDIKDEYLCKGCTEKDAEEAAVKIMGNPKKIGKKLNKIHRPKLDWKILILIAILIGFRIIISLKNYIEGIEFCELMGWPCDDMSFLITQYPLIKSLIIGLVIGTIIYFFDYRKTKK